MSLKRYITRVLPGAVALAAMAAALASCSSVRTPAAVEGSRPVGSASTVLPDPAGCPANPGACIKRAVSERARGDERAGARTLEGVIASRPGTVWAARAAFLLGRIRLASPKRPSPDSDTAALFRLSETGGLGHMGDYFLFYEARSLAAAGDHLAAASAWGRVLDEYPDSLLLPEAEYLRAVSLESAGEAPAAEAAYRAYAARHPGHGDVADALLRLATLSLDTGGGGVKEAAGAIRKLLVDHPADPAAKGAEGLLERLRAAGGGEVELTGRERYIRAENLFDAAMFEEAAVEFTALAEDQGSGYANSGAIRLADCLVRLKRYGEAEDLMAEYLEGENPVRELDALGLLALSRLRQGDTGGLEAAAERLARSYPRSGATARALLFTARSYERGGESGRAVRAYRRIIGELAGGPNGWAAEEARWSIGWIYYTSGRYWEALNLFGESVEKGLSASARDRFLYWGGRSAENFGLADRAGELYGSLCGDHPRGYYCLMATERLAGLFGPSEGVSEIAPFAPPALGASGLSAGRGPEPSKSFMSDRHYLAARELLGLGLDAEAAEELTFLVKRHARDKGALARLAGLFYASGDYYRAFRVYRNNVYGLVVSAQDGLHGELTPPEFSYPRALVERIRGIAPEAFADPYLVAAVIREESTYNPGAVSRTGAVGLMQIMPSTGRYIAGRLGVEPFTRDDLLDPDTNIRFGAWYLGHLWRRFDHNVILTVAGYNAGPGAVSRWVATLPADPDVFIESIPYSETRNYAKKVLASYSGFLRASGARGEGTFALPSLVGKAARAAGGG
ncbi:MAG: transglycosylase SLT domain-containing protein [Thermodesulfobacteriota bacterium]